MRNNVMTQSSLLNCFIVESRNKKGYYCKSFCLFLFGERIHWKIANSFLIGLDLRPEQSEPLPQCRFNAQGFKDFRRELWSAYKNKYKWRGVCKWRRERERVCVWKSEKKRESVYACVCAYLYGRERKSECVYEWEKISVTKQKES